MRNEFEIGIRQELVIDLDGCLEQVEASRAWFARRVLPLTIEQLRWRPDPRHWSIAECLDHLNLTLGVYLPKVEDALESGWRQGKTCQGPRNHDRREFEALKLVEPPVSVRHSAPTAIVPSAAVDPDWLVDRFHQTRDHYAEAVRRAFGLDLSRIPIVKPLFPVIASLGGALAFLAAHDRRHMWQSERVRNSPRFPHAVFGNGRAGQAGVPVRKEPRGDF